MRPEGAASSTLSLGERLFKRIIANPKIYPPKNYIRPEGRLSRLARELAGFCLSRFGPRVRRWHALFGAPRPKLLVLDSPKVGGSHFVLHHLQCHPQLLCLHERILANDSRSFLTSGATPVYDLAANQLLPYKSDFGRVKHVVLNKPSIASIHELLFAFRQEVAVLQLVRNPVAYCLGRALYLRRRPELRRDEVEEQLLALLKETIRRSVDAFEPARDMVFTLEYFACHPGPALAEIERRLGLEHAAAHRSLALERCARCGGRLRLENRPVRTRPPEPVQVCSRCRAVYIGPGGYNLLRAVESDNFSRWADNPRAPRLLALCEAFFGAAYMDYFRQERYRDPAGCQEFTELFLALLNRIKQQ